MPSISAPGHEKDAGTEQRLDRPRSRACARRPRPVTTLGGRGQCGREVDSELERPAVTCTELDGHAETTHQPDDPVVRREGRGRIAIEGKADELPTSVIAGATAPDVFDPSAG